MQERLSKGKKKKKCESGRGRDKRVCEYVLRAWKDQVKVRESVCRYGKVKQA